MGITKRPWEACSQSRFELAWLDVGLKEEFAFNYKKKYVVFWSGFGSGLCLNCFRLLRGWSIEGLKDVSRLSRKRPQSLSTSAMPVARWFWAMSRLIMNLLVYSIQVVRQFVTTKLGTVVTIVVFNHSGARIRDCNFFSLLRNS